MGVESRNDALTHGNRPGNGASNPPKATIIVMDDDDLYRDSLSRLLRDENYAVLPAADISSIDGLLDNHPVDLLVADSRLPDGDGWAKAAQLSGKYANLRVLYVSGYDEDAIAFIGGTIVHGAITKQISRTSVLNAIDEALRE